MRIRVSGKDLSELKADLAVSFAWEGDREPGGIADIRLRRELARQLDAEEFRGQPGDRLVWNAGQGYPARRFAVIGLGRRRDDGGEALRLGAARAARLAESHTARSLALRLPPVANDVSADAARVALEGALLGTYRFDHHVTDPTRSKPALSSLELALEGSPGAVKRAVKLGGIGARAVCLARDLVNEPPSDMNPTALARAARAHARTSGLGCRVLDAPELRRLRMGALLGVARGSAEPPLVVHLTYKPPARAKAKRRIVLVGKGVTFDSGGLDLKPSESMRTMKCDMAGAAAVLGAMVALRDVGCKAEVHGVLGLVENMTGPAAYKPGDILRTLSGKTVEVGNTDAEGRLVLADVISWAVETIEPDALVDVATLTGACVVALGTRATGLFTRHDGLRDELLAAGRAAGEKLWPLPMYEEYLELMQKGPADLCSTAGRWGGAITAALFLGEFVPRELPWAHLDIAGPSLAEKDLPEAREGGTGAAVLTLLRWLETV